MNRDGLLKKLETRLLAHEYTLDEPLMPQHEVPYYGLSASATINKINKLEGKVYFPIKLILRDVNTPAEIRIFDFLIHCLCEYATGQYFYSCRNTNVQEALGVSRATLNGVLNKFSWNWLKKQQGWNEQGVKRDEEISAYSKKYATAESKEQEKFITKQIQGGHIQNVYSFWMKSEKTQLSTKARKEKLYDYAEQSAGIPKEVFGKTDELFMFYTNAQISPIPVLFGHHDTNSWKCTKKPIFAAPTEHLEVFRRGSKKEWQRYSYSEKLELVRRMKFRNSDISGMGRYLLANEVVFDCDGKFALETILTVKQVLGDTFTTKTPSNGKHVHYMAADKPTKDLLTQVGAKYKSYKLDTLRKGNFALCAGSKDAKDRFYRTENFSQIAEVDYRNAMKLASRLKAHSTVDKIINLKPYLDKITPALDKKNSTNCGNLSETFQNRFDMSGNRHISLMTHAGYLAKHHSNINLLEALMAANQCFNNPLSESEVFRIAKYAG